MAFFPASPQYGKDSYGNPVKKLDKNGKHMWSKSVDTDHPKKAKTKAITLRKGRGREGSMEHKATGLHNTRKLLD